MKIALIVINLIICGFLVIAITLFFASGTIAENYTDQTFVAPEYFFILLIWFLSVVLLGVYIYKRKIEHISYPEIIFIHLIPWISLFVGFFIIHFASF
ncbi:MULTISPECIES: hypothetical protein [Oceanobacillus]|uniref:hypothetical protein n=1 Tax=Oceanobacillus TaxID=182709 RepID=UPI0003499242|nr:MULTISPECIES: hypothetical protein [Oceanobacillus]MBT2599301.1 hypothetical protein [Oceanobacillus sp. ISL-74]MBT2652219.1 hypothetical protein [Oceanobacillus sp. ISL-73]OEH54143.1 hypothetical protein AQ616_10285 [Oceanobacillus sp. E9]